MDIGYDGLDYYDVSKEFFSDPKCCDSCDEHEEQKGFCSFWLKEIFDQLYGEEELDVEQLERDLSELACEFKVKIPKHDIRVARV